MKNIKFLITKTYTSWEKDNPFSSSAAASYYALFSIPGLLMVIMAIAALAFDREYVKTELLKQIAQTFGSDIASTLETIIQNIQQQNRNTISMVIGIATLIFGATGLFSELQQNFNSILITKTNKKTAEKTAIQNFIHYRLKAFAAVSAMGFLLIISLFITIILTILSTFFSNYLPGYLFILIKLGEFIASFFITTLIFGLMYKILTDAILDWKSALIGGAVASIFFTIGKTILTIYFSLSKPASAFGATGSIVLLMLWISYSCLILLFGAHFIKTYTEKINI
jgi:membrane protein